MRYVLVALSLVSLLDSRLLAELMEFPAGSSTSLKIPTGNSIQIKEASAKGDAGEYIKFSITVGGTSYDLNEYRGLSGLYINGPASLNVSPVTITPLNNIPYKLDRYGSIWKDSTGLGNFTIRLLSEVPPTIALDGTTTEHDPNYQAYLTWKNAGNVPLPADAYTGNNIAGSGVLIDFTRYSNQPFKTLLIPTGTTQAITVPDGKKIICNPGQRAGFPVAIHLNFTGSESNAAETEPLGFFIKIRGYIMNSQEIDGPETLIVGYNQTSLGGGGSATATFGSQQSIPGFSSGIFTYYYSDESSTPVSDSDAKDIVSKIVSTSGNYGLATKNELTPLASKSLVANLIDEGKASGIASVRASPNTWSLFTTSQIQNMAVGDLVLTKDVGGTFTLNYDIEQSTDLQTWTTYAPLSLPLTGLPTDKAFVRIKAKQADNTNLGGTAPRNGASPHPVNAGGAGDGGTTGAGGSNDGD